MSERERWKLGSYRGIKDEYDIETITGRELSGQRGMFASKADAELAASAPDLYEALYDLLTYAQENEDFCDPARLPEMYATKVAAKDAIAKAEGRKS